MTLETLAEYIFIWVTRYLAGLCLLTIAFWGASMYLWSKHWHTRIRDAGVYLGAIGILTLIMAMRPEKTSGFWPPLIWFCFPMLIVLELLWLSFLLESIMNLLRPPAKPPTRPLFQSQRRHAPSRPNA